MRGHAGARLGVACRGHRAQAAHEGQGLIGYRDRTPAQLADRQVAFLPRHGCGANEASIDAPVTARVLDRGANTIEPRALVARLRRRERRARQLLRIEAETNPLRRIAPDRQCACKRLALEGVAESGHVAGDEADPGAHASWLENAMSPERSCATLRLSWAHPGGQSSASSPAARALSAERSSAIRW